MTIQLRQAERLCSATELSLVKAALAPALGELDEKRLAAHITRARRARDKHRDLLGRQQLSSRERTGQKAGRSGDANPRARAKAELFDEVLERFEARMSDLGGRGERESGGVARDKAGEKVAKKKAAMKKTAKKASTKKASTKKAATKKAATKKAATKKAATKKAATKKAATKKAATKKAATKKATKKAAQSRPAVEPDANALVSSPSAAGTDGGPEVKTPAERVAEKVRANLQRTGVARQATDPDVTDREGARFVSDRAKVAAQQAGSHGAREQAIHGHIRSAVRRNQAKRDNKG